MMEEDNYESQKADNYAQPNREFTPIFLDYCQKWVFLSENDSNQGYLNWNEFGCIQDIEEGLKYEYENLPISALDEYQYFSSVIDDLMKLEGFSDFVKGNLSPIKLEELRKIKTTRLNKSKAVIQKVTDDTKSKVFVHGDEFRETKDAELKPRRIVNVKKRFGGTNYERPAPKPETPVIPVPKTKEGRAAEKEIHKADHMSE